MRWLVWLVGLVAAACYAPAAQPGAPCTPGADNCPEGQQCLAAPEGFACSTGQPVVDAATDSTPPGDGSPLCFGTGLVRNLCFPQPPSGTLTVTGTSTIDTATVGGTN